MRPAAPSSDWLLLKYGLCPRHCEAGEELWLQGEAALKKHSFRDMEPQPGIGVPAIERALSDSAVTRLRNGSVRS